MNRLAGATAALRTGAIFVILGLLLSTFGIVTGVGLMQPTSASAADAVSSAVTQKWADGGVVGGRDSDLTSNPDYAVFKDLSVTVSQTSQLADQGVSVTWTGAKATSTGEFATNYLQIMQCWGDAATGPTPDQCQFGAASASLAALAGTDTTSRTLGQLNSDPVQSYDDSVLMPRNPARPNARNYAVPFRSVSGDSVFDVSSYFASGSTNEVDAVRTGSDGSGLSVFQLQTSLTAPHLGCGATTSAGTARSCWLVVVPRGVTNTNGTAASDNVGGRVSGSPLSASAWRNRIVFPMSFLATSSSCSIGSSETRIVGNEMATDAVSSWQSAICKSGTTIGYSQLGDDEGKTQLASTSGGGVNLAVVSSDVSATEVDPKKVAYAPLAQNAIVVAYNIDRNFSSDSSLASTNGTPVSNLTLSPRLIAKLLTQSYRVDVPGGGTSAPLTSNPYTLVRDPEFIELNPEFSDFVTSAYPDGLIVSLGTGDNIAEVWNWLKADPLTAAFLDGKPDEWGMTINPAYKSLAITADTSINSFPKADLSIADASAATGAPGYGTLDMRPYADDFANAAYRAARADSGSKIVWDVTKSPAQYTSSGAQLPGQRFELALTTLSAATRYGLNVAKLVNAAGQAVAPTDATVQAGISAMVSSSSSDVVKVSDFSKRVLDAYPLATVSYAAIAICNADKSELKGYSTLLKYAAGSGQVRGTDVGQLPLGYLPLSSSQKAQLKTVAATITNTSAISAACDPASASPSPSASPKASASSTPKATGPEVPVATAPSSEAAAPVAAASQEPSLDLVAGSTPIDDSGLRGKAVAISLALGIPVFLSGLVLIRRGRKLARARA